MARTCIIRDNEICVHFYEKRKVITFSQKISEFLYKNNLRNILVEIVINPNGGMLLKMCAETDEGLQKSPKSEEYRRLSFNTRRKRPTASISNKKFVNIIARHFLLDEGKHFLVLNETHVEVIRGESYTGCSFVIAGPRPIPQETTKQCPHCGRTLPMDEFYHSDGRVQSWCKDCCRDRGRLRNGTTGEYRDDPTISKATDQQLYDELKRRGYKGTMSITKTLQ